MLVFDRYCNGKTGSPDGRGYRSVSGGGTQDGYGRSSEKDHTSDGNEDSWLTPGDETASGYESPCE